MINVEPMYAATDLDLLPLAFPDRPRVAARLKAIPEDFEVDEIPVYTPCGQGGHLFLWVEKRDVAGGDLLKRLAAELAIAPQDIGAAGTKDRRAVTRQWLSVPEECEDRLPWVRQLADIHILNVVRHGNKLRTGHLWGNRFSILLRDADPACLADLAGTARLVAERGFPNFFGTQRFGWSKDTLRIGLARLGPIDGGGGGAVGAPPGTFRKTHDRIGGPVGVVQPLPDVPDGAGPVDDGAGGRRAAEDGNGRAVRIVRAVRGPGAAGCGRGPADRAGLGPQDEGRARRGRSPGARRAGRGRADARVVQGVREARRGDPPPAVHPPGRPAHRASPRRHPADVRAAQGLLCDGADARVPAARGRARHRGLVPRPGGRPRPGGHPPAGSDD